ncbi:2'-5' RNA ligase family protein [Chryseobacterium caseinilyticum]|uniref:2'-5' RNA ligase family protein n=1 Tax=Chryseobacterium caseinilyticum TaxID=2771428 RepID=A0ABR8ZAW6_9FLAO|nr:hypothetical protein [Chryseobacterium caseinilyticum]MBD8082381.1 hypothetical protein [Chryseobacterium caseinilyticum]
MLNRYSIVIHPDDPILTRFKSYKDTLFNKVGDFKSRDSKAHITILEFDATEKELANIIKKIIMIAQRECSFDSVFNNVIYSKTLLILPDTTGNEHFKGLLKRVRARIKGISNKSEAHLTIGRELKPHQIENSIGLFPDVNFNFHCKQFALRMLDRNVGEFEIRQTFPFLGETPIKKGEQLSFDF